MRASRIALTTVAVLAFAAFTVTSALANQISIGGPSAENVTYTSNGNGSTVGLTLGSSNAACGAAPLCLSDSGTFVLSGGVLDDNGQYAFATSSATPITLTNSGGGVFTVTSAPGTTNFSWTSTSDTDKMAGVVTWLQVDDGSPDPFLYGRLNVTSVSGDSAFTSTFPAGFTTEVDFNITGGCSAGVSPCTLNNLVTTAAGSTLSGPISGGEVAAEPASAALLLVVLGAFGLALTRKRAILA